MSNKKTKNNIRDPNNVNMSYQEKLNFVLDNNIRPARFDPAGYLYSSGESHKYGCIYRSLNGDINEFIRLCKPPKPTKPSLPRNPSPTEARDYANELEEWETKMNEYEANLLAWKKFKNVVDGIWEQRFFDEYGISEHPRRADILSFARCESGDLCVNPSTIENKICAYMDDSFGDLFLC